MNFAPKMDVFDDKKLGDVTRVENIAARISIFGFYLVPTVYLFQIQYNYSTST